MSVRIKLILIILSVGGFQVVFVLIELVKMHLPLWIAKLTVSLMLPLVCMKETINVLEREFAQVTEPMVMEIIARL